MSKKAVLALVFCMSVVVLLMPVLVLAAPAPVTPADETLRSVARLKSSGAFVIGFMSGTSGAGA